MKKMTISEAAKIMKMSSLTLMEGIALGLIPVGICLDNGRKQRHFIVYPKKVADWMLENYGEEVNLDEEEVQD